MNAREINDALKDVERSLHIGEDEDYGSNAIRALESLLPVIRELLRQTEQKTNG